MLRTSAVRHSPPPKIAPRRTSPSPQPYQHRQRSSVLARFRHGSLLVSLFLCLAGVGVYIWPRVQVVRLAYRMQTAEQRVSELLQERDQLRLALATLKNPQRIYRLATDQLGMQTPRHDQVVILPREPKRR